MVLIKRHAPLSTIFTDLGKLNLCASRRSKKASELHWPFIYSENCGAAVNGAVAYPIGPALAGFQTYALEEGLEVSIPAYPHVHPSRRFL